MMLEQSNMWFLIAFAVLAVYLITGGAVYINCIKPILGYVNIFRQENGKLMVRHLLFFMSFPAILATATNIDTEITSSILNTISVIITILTTMIYSFMAIINAKYESATQNDDISYSSYTWVQTAHKETIDIITTEVLVSVLLLLLCFIQPLVGTQNLLQNVVKFDVSPQKVCGWLIFDLFYFFIINLLIVTKRFYNITQRQL